MSHSEATRLLCAGVHLDQRFRRRVIEELVEHEERHVAPSLGLDVEPVLAHALLGRRREAATAGWLLAVWALFLVLAFAAGGSGSAPLAVPAYAAVCVWLWLARVLSGQSAAVYAAEGRPAGLIARWRYRAAWGMRFGARCAMAAYLLGGVFVFGPLALALPAVLVLPVWAHRAWFDRVLRDELSRESFRRREPLRLPPSYARVREAIAREQHATLAIYDSFQPFVGYGRPYEPWSFAIELRPVGGTQKSTPLTARRVVELVAERVWALRTPAVAHSADRLRGLTVEHLAYLPPAPRRGRVSYEPGAVGEQVAVAIDEGGEGRRYFMRVRVGAWNEQIVVSVLVRVHTQGGMLVLEVVPHVLTPVRPEFRAADALAARAGGGGVRNVVRAVTSSPTAVFASALSGARTLLSVYRHWLADPARLPAEGPAASVRELGSAGEVSLFQEMDISRYVKTVQDRIASGVTEALRETGYETDEFKQQVVHVSRGGVFIGEMSGGAVASGEGATAHAEGGA